MQGTTTPSVVEVVKYTCLESELSDLLDQLDDLEGFDGFTCFRSGGKWMISVPKGSRSVWNVLHYDSIADGLSGLFVQVTGQLK